LTKLEDHLWVVDGTLDLLPIGRRMTVVRLSDGSLLLHSVVCCNDETMSAIEAVGTVRFIVVPSAFHRIDAPRYARRYPDAAVLAAPASRKQVAKVVEVTGDYGSLPEDPRLTHEILDGVELEAVFIFRNDAGAATLIMNDGMMNLPDALPGVRGLITKLIGSTGGPKVTPTAKLGLVKDRKAYAEHLRRLAALPNLERIVMSHGAIIDRDAGSVLQGVANDLAP
jgi:hypothetical protein